MAFIISSISPPSGKRSWKSSGCRLKSQATKYLSNFGKQLDDNRLSKTISYLTKRFLL